MHIVEYYTQAIQPIMYLVRWDLNKAYSSPKLSKVSGNDNTFFGLKKKLTALLILGIESTFAKQLY